MSAETTHVDRKQALTVSMREVFQPSARQPAPAVLARFSPEDRLRLRRIIAEPIEYIDHVLFSKPSALRNAFSECPEVLDATRQWCNASDTSALPSVTLSTDNEVRLFLRLNHARLRMIDILKQFVGKRLTAKVAHDLLGWHAQAMAARCEIVQANVPLVLAMAKRTRLGSVDYAELISEGNMALLRSVDKFDCSRGFKFSTYACRAILKSFSRVAMRSSRYRNRFPTEFDPSLEKSDFLDQQRTEAEVGCVEDLRGILARNLAELNEVESKVIKARFALCAVEGLQGDGPRTLEQVGMLIGVTKERVRQIQNRALEKLRTKLQDDFLAA